MTALPREIESKYVVLEKMGEGGMGAVYKVRHRFFDEVQVIKFMQAKFQGDEELKSRFLQEARTAKKVKHTNIAEVIDYSVTADGTAYIVMEFVDGVNLREVLRRTGGPLDHALVIEIGLQTLAALGELHRHGFVHRDVAPDNLLLSRDANGAPLIKLIDLGIAKSVENSTQDLTKTGRFMGKMQYASPEQFGGVEGDARVDQRSDLYSFGCVLYELLTGMRLVTSSDYRAVIAAHLYRPPRSFDETDPEGKVPKPLREVVLKALAKDPNERYQNAEELANSLRRAAGISSAAPEERTLEVRTEDDAWRVAEQKGTSRAWEEFLEAFPDSARAREAQGHLEQAEKAEETDWEKANAADSIEAWNGYLAVHPESARASRARRRLDRLTEDAERTAYETAASDRSAEAWELFLKEFPRSRRASEVREELAKMREDAAEENDFSSAAQTDSTGAWRTFLKKHSRSQRAEAARARLEAARRREDENNDWKRAEETNTEEGWKRFAQLHPDSKRAVVARDRAGAAAVEELDAADWEVASRTNSVLAWNTYIDRHPKSSRMEAAKQNLAAAREREEAGLRELSETHRREAIDRAFEEAAEIDSIDGWEVFLREFPDSPRDAEARKRLGAAMVEQQSADAWKKTIEVNTAEAYESFVRNFPNSSRAAEAESRGKEIREKLTGPQRQREQAAWSTAESLGTPDAWREYLRQNPSSPRSGQARTNLEAATRRVREEADYAAAIGRGDRAPLEKFLKDHPNSHRAAAARERLNELSRTAVEKTMMTPLEKVPKADTDYPATAMEQLPVTRRGAPTDAEATRIDAPMPTTAARAEARPRDVTRPAVPVPAPAPAPAPAPTMRAPVEAPSSPNRLKLIIAAVAVVIVLIGIIVVIKARKGSAVTTTPVTETTSTAPPVPGTLVINALPWGEVQSIKDATGAEHLDASAKPAYTPFTVSLPPGKYSVELANPNSHQTNSCSATVAANASVRCEVPLDSIDVDTYIKQVTGK